MLKRITMILLGLFSSFVCLVELQGNDRANLIEDTGNPNNVGEDHGLLPQNAANPLAGFFEPGGDVPTAFDRLTTGLNEFVDQLVPIAVRVGIGAGVVVCGWGLWQLER